MRRAILIITICIRMFLFSGSVKSNGVILEDIVRTLDTSSSWVAWAFALQNGIAYIISPLVLLLLRVFSNRQLCIFGGMLSTLGYLFCSFYLQSLWQLFAGFILSGIGFGLSALPAFLVLQEYIKAEDLPLVISITALFDFVGVAVLPPVMQYFRRNYGLHNSLLLFSALLSNIIVTGIAAKKPVRGIPEIATLQQEDAKTDKDSKHDSFRHECLRNMSQLFYHKNLATLLIAEFVALYVFVSWAIFLVSLGKTLGLSEEEATLLSTAGGIGGLFGKSLAIALAHLNKMNATTSILIPLLITGASFLIVVHCYKFYVIAPIIFISGISQGLYSSGVFSLIPTLVCSYHYQQALTIEYLAGGVAMQFSGLLSGIIQDITESTTYVYVFNAVICFGLIPSIISWARNEEPTLDCEYVRSKTEAS